ncbi:MAG: response regulator transcription factor, partial [Planctomycetes bacterium]|nr:response regulator transcription factor [Planctomycetota bacterium]
REYPNFEVVGHSGDPREALEEIAELKPHVVLLDISMRGLSGIDVIDKIHKDSPHSRVLMLTQHEGGRFVHQALDAGAVGYLSKNSDPEELRIAIEAVHCGETYVSPRVAGALRDHPQNGSAADGLATLTAREREVFQLLALGKANKEVAMVLKISPATVKKHRENLQAKLDCHSPADLARLAIREGLLDD